MCTVPNYFEVNGYRIVEKHEEYHIFTKYWEHVCKKSTRKDAIQFCLALLQLDDGDKKF